MSRGGGRSALLTGMVVLVWRAVLPQAAAQANAAGLPMPRDTAPEPVIVELQVGRLASRTVTAFRVRTEVLVPLTQLLELAEIRFRLTAEGQLEARVDPGDRRLVVDIRRDTMSFGGHRVRIEPEFKLFRDGELYVGAERVGDLFGARIVVTWSDLVVTFVDPAALPIGRRARREATRAAFLRRGEQLRPELELAVERPAWDGLVFDYSIFSPSTAPLAGASYTAALGVDAFGGSLEVGVASVGPAEDGATRVDASWTGVWRESRWAKQLRLGDVPSTSPRVRSLRGVSVTNSPFLRPSYVGDVAYGGRLGPGWSVEAYSGGDLVAYDSTDGAGGFAVGLPVRYGENPVDFVAYGPFGEIREFNRTYRVIAELLPVGRFEYGVSVGECRAPLCDAMANLDARYGVGLGWTVRAGAEQFWRDSLGGRFHPYAALAGMLTNAWALEVEGAGRAFLRGGLRYEPSLQLRVAVDAASYATDSTPALFFAGQRSQWGATAFWRPTLGAGFAFLEARVEGARTRQGTQTRGRLSGSYQAADVRWLPFVRFERAPGAARTEPFGGLDVFVLPRPVLGPVLGSIWMRGGAEVGRAGFTSASVVAARPLGSGIRAEVGAVWGRGAPAPLYTAVVTTYLPGLRSSTALSVPPRTPALATQYVQGSVLWDRATGRLAVAPGPSVERGGVAGQVFLDENGNGLKDTGEPGLGGVRVRVGTVGGRSDSSGAYRVWDVVPFEPLVVEMDSLSLPSPLLVPAFASVSIVPGPNRFRVLDLPVARAGVIEGRVTRSGRGVGGAGLVLTERRTGAQRRFTTFSDGEFYALGVKPGDYELTVESRVLDILGAIAQPVRFTLAPTAQGVGRSGIVVDLRARP
jgi:hypothetical protein